MTAAETLEQLDAILASRREAGGESSYTASLYAAGTPRIVAKIDEEAAEVAEAAGEDDDVHLTHEVADLWFHCMVLLQSRGIESHAVLAELAKRMGISGLDEKASRASQSSDD